MQSADRIQNCKNHHPYVRENRPPHVGDAHCTQQKTRKLDNKGKHDVLIDDPDAFSGDFDPLCADVYAKAEDGYFRAKENLEVSIASEPISEKLEKRLEILKQFVEKAETAAAYKLKEQSDAEKSQRTTA